jgi:hypothetical protein
MPVAVVVLALVNRALDGGVNSFISRVQDKQTETIDFLCSHGT